MYIYVFVPQVAGAGGHHCFGWWPSLFGYQTVVSKIPGLHCRSPNSGELRYKSRGRKSEVGSALMAGGRQAVGMVAMFVERTWHI